MPALAREQENTSSILNWFISIQGVLTDAYEVGFQIFDITGGLPGTQVFPAVEDEWEVVTAAPGNFSPGSYYAYDNTAGNGYTPPISATIGTHRIFWRWKISVSAPYQQDAEDFEILPQSAGSTTDTYITVQDVRDAGLTNDTAYPDAAVLAAIELWQSILDRACRQWFAPKALVLSVDGNGSDTLQFGVPIISIEYVKLNSDTTELSVDSYKVYNAITYPDDRRNPCIKVVRSVNRDIFTSQYGELCFRKGRKNQEISGVFGFVEEDMSAPKPIQRALLKLVIEKITKPLYVEDAGAAPPSPPPIMGSIVEEWTDGHRLKYGKAGAEVSKRSPYLTGITDDQEIIEIIKMFRAPIGCATPTDW